MCRTTLEEAESMQPGGRQPQRDHARETRGKKEGDPVHRVRWNRFSRDSSGISQAAAWQQGLVQASWMRSLERGDVGSSGRWCRGSGLIAAASVSSSKWITESSSPESIRDRRSSAVLRENLGEPDGAVFFRLASRSCRRLAAPPEQGSARMLQAFEIASGIQRRPQEGPRCGEGGPSREVHGGCYNGTSGPC
jgi:hypothetical protein